MKGNKEKICQQLVVASLLGDGVSCCVVSGKESPLYNSSSGVGNKSPEIIDNHRIFVPHTETYLGSMYEDWYVLHLPLSISTLHSYKIYLVGCVDGGSPVFNRSRCVTPSLHWYSGNMLPA